MKLAGLVGVALCGAAPLVAQIAQGAPGVKVGPAGQVHIVCDTGCSGSGGGGNPTAGYLDSLGLVKKSRDSLITSTNHAGRFSVDSFVGCTTVGTCVIYAKLDSVPVTTAGRLDSVSRINHATDSIAFPLPAGTNKLGAIGDSVYFVKPGGYGDSVNLIPQIRYADTLKFLANGNAIIFPSTTDSIGYVQGKNAADSILLPAKSGLRHYITSVCWMITDSTTTTSAAAPDTVTTTNLAATPTWLSGNTVAAGGQVLPFGTYCQNFTRPLVANAQNTITKFRGNATGAHTVETLEVHYYLEP